MKIFERAIQKQLTAFLKKNSILCAEQSGFRENHSTKTATTDVTDFILKNMDNGLFTGAVYLDLKKAFDTVDFETLLYKLQCIGVRGTEHTWFANYLYERNQCVLYDSALSEALSVTCGVPQGSILGPLLLILFVKDFPSVVKHSKVVLYADDTVLLYSSSAIDDIQKCLISDLNLASKWFSNNKLHLNTTKCKWTLFGSEKRLKDCTIPQVKIDNAEIEHVESYKYLGLLLDANLNWNEHVNSLCKKLRQRLGVLRRVRGYLDQATALMLFNALVLPIADYCDTVYGNCSKTLQSKIDRLLCKGGRIVLNVPFDTPSRTVIDDLKWLTFTERLQFHRCMSVFKCINQQMPDYMKCKFEQFSHQYNTRDEKSLILPKCKTDMGQRTFSFTGARDWNSLSCAIKRLTSQNSFRTKLIDFILESRSQHYFIHF